MAWYYNRIYPLGTTTSGSYKATVAPPGAKPYSDYEFVQITDPGQISTINQIANLTTGPLFGPYASLSDAQAAAAKFPPETLDQSMMAGRTNVPGVTAGLDAASGIVSTGINATGAGINLIAALTQASTWIRIAEVVLGLLLIGVGIAKLTTNVALANYAAQLAKKTGKAFT